MAAFSRVVDTKQNDQDDEESVHFSEHSHSSAYKLSDEAAEFMPLSQAKKEGVAYSSNEAQPPKKNQAITNESYIETMDPPQKAGFNCSDSRPRTKKTYNAKHLGCHMVRYEMWSKIHPVQRPRSSQHVVLPQQLEREGYQVVFLNCKELDAAGKKKQ